MSPNPPFAADLVTFAEEILNGKLHFLCSAYFVQCLLWEKPISFKKVRRKLGFMHLL